MEWVAYRSHVVHDDVSALHIHTRDVGHNPVQKIAELGVVWAGRIRVHLQGGERSARGSAYPCMVHACDCCRSSLYHDSTAGVWLDRGLSAGMETLHSLHHNALFTMTRAPDGHAERA